MLKVPFLIFVFCSFSHFSKAFDTLKIGIKHAPPFAIKTETGWEGLNLEIWRRVQSELQIESVFYELDMAEMTTRLAKGTIDLGLGAVTVSSSREAQFNFTNSIYPSGLGIAFLDEETDGLSILSNLLSANFVKIICLLCAVLLLVGLLIWWFEHKKNQEFEEGYKGIFSGFWWSAVTMTTVGYGDKAPKSIGGKVLALVWMFASLIMISYFTASIASALTVKKFETRISSPSDLQKVRVGLIEGTITENYLRQNRIAFVAFKNLDEIFQAIERKEIDAVVADYPILKYHLHKNPNPTIKMLPHKVNEFFYAIPLRNNLPMAEDIKRVVQSFMESAEWKQELNLYFGNID